jgi:surface polysaccharide O-acyltransferase-like enzyme
MNEYLSIKLRIISFFSIILVVYLHSYNLVINLNSETFYVNQGYSSFIQNFISQGITRIAVPLFFLISGYLFFINFNENRFDFLIKFKKRIKTLFIPYFFWSILCLILFLIMESIPQLDILFTNKNILDYTIYEFISSVITNPIPYQLWFLRDLMVLVVLSPILFYLLKKFRYFTIVVFMVAWFLDFKFIFFSNESLFFFGFGVYISIHKKQILEIKFSKKELIYTLIWFVILFYKNTLIYLSKDNVNLLFFLHKISVLIGVFAIWSLYDVIFINRDLKQSKLFNFSNYSFFIFVFHEPMLSFFKKILFYLLNKNEYMSILIYIIAPLTTIIVCIFVGYFLKNFTPKFYSIITGGR